MSSDSSIRVALLPQNIPADTFAGTIAVMIDVFRASTSMIHGLANDANCVVPCLTIDDAREQAAARENSLLAGERGGTAIDGFDLDNSPARYNRETVADRSIVMTTTNGTRALLHAQAADEVLVGAFVNRTALVNYLAARHKPVIFVCAGTDGQVTSEDVLFAGSAARKLASVRGPKVSIDDPARIAMDFYRSNSENPDSLLAAARAGLGGSNLVKLGFDNDIRLAMTADVFSIVPQFDPKTGEIRPVP